LLSLLSNLTEDYQQPLALPPVDLEDPEDIASFEDAQQDRLNIALQNAQLTKQDVIAAAKKHCDSDFEKSETGGHYTAWSSMKTLLGRGLVCTRGAPGGTRANPARFWLTRDGWASALALKEALGPVDQTRKAGRGGKSAADNSVARGTAVVRTASDSMRPAVLNPPTLVREGNPLLFSYLGKFFLTTS
jgi:hypothetical protein